MTNDNNFSTSRVEDDDRVVAEFATQTGFPGETQEQAEKRKDMERFLGSIFRKNGIDLERIKKSVEMKGLKLDEGIDEIVHKYKQYNQFKSSLENLQAEKRSFEVKKPTPEQIAKGKKLKIEIQDKLENLQIECEKIYKLAFQIPNTVADDVKKGVNEKDNKEVKKWGEEPNFEFKVRDHIELGEKLDLIDIKRAAKISGTRFGYLKNEAVLLELALIQLALETLIKEGFIPVVPPVLIKKQTMQGMGYLEHDGEDEMYALEKDGLFLVGTSEQSIGPMHMNEILNKNKLPLRYVGFSSCFRREAGSYGKDTRGIFRVHQFDKVEMVSICKPENGDKEHEYLLSLEEKLFQALKIPYRVMKMCTGDLGAPAARKYDIEAWIPSQKKYREVTSTSTTTDFQSRRLNIKYREKGKKVYVHMLNGTAFAIGRTLIAIMENYQQKDCSIKVPEVLQEYVGKKEIAAKKRSEEK